MELIDKRAAYEALKHEAEMHELPFTREAYERAARIIDQMYAYTIEAEPVRTNGDRIRNMTDEALVGIVFKKVCEIIRPDGDCKGVYFGNCEKCVLQWLKQEVSEDVGTD